MAHRSAAPADPGADRPRGVLELRARLRPGAAPAGRQARVPSAQSWGQPWPWAVPQEPVPRGPGPASGLQRRKPSMRRTDWSPPTRRKLARAAEPRRPRYGNSLRKTLSEPVLPDRCRHRCLSRLGRLSLCQLRRLRDRVRRLDQLPALNTAAGEKKNGDKNLLVTPRPPPGALG